MGTSLNKATLIGRVGKEPTVRYTAGGQAVANFQIATDETYTDRNQEKQKKTEWHNIVCWGTSAEKFVGPYVGSGTLVYVEGKLQTRQWEDKRDGSKRYTTEIVVLDIKILADPKGNGKTTAPKQTAARPAQQQQSRQQTRQRQADPEPEVSDEDIPF